MTSLTQDKSADKQPKENLGLLFCMLGMGIV